MKKVYIVDDDMDLVESMTITLENNDFEVKSQYDDKDLAANIRSFNPNLIILDVMFPDDEGAGFKMARTIKHHDNIKEIPIMMLSGVNQEGSFVGSFTQKDVDDVYLPVSVFLEKPIDPKALVEKANELIDG